MKLIVQLPAYPAKATTKGVAKPGMAWRRRVYEAIRKAVEDANVSTYPAKSLVDCRLRIALGAARLDLQDVDNLLKHVFDAMQGRLGGPKAKKRGWHLVPNDFQIRRVTVEKVAAPARKYGSRLTVSRYVQRKTR
jgi:Holliday junction resolvase RusA-like endonuclease